MSGRATRFAAAIQALLLMATLMLPALASAAVWTDQADYSPGSVVTISGDNSDGAGYLPGETVDVDVTGPNGYTASCSATADENGAWSCQITLWDSSLAVGDYSYTATGQLSGVSQTGTFTDGAAVDINNKNPNAGARPWFRIVAGGFDVTITGTNTCSTGGSGVQKCSSPVGVSVALSRDDNAAAIATKAATLNSPSAGNWTVSFAFRTAPGSGQFAVPADGLVDAVATYTWNVCSGSPACTPTGGTSSSSEPSDKHFGIDNTAPSPFSVNVAKGVSNITASGDADDATSGMQNVVARLYSGACGTGTLLDTQTDSAGFPGWSQGMSGGGYSNPGNFCVRGTATDLAGNSVTVDTPYLNDQAPSVVSTTPADNATDVPVDSDIDIDWDEGVTLDANAITVACPAGTPIAGVISGSGSSHSFNPTADLPASTVCVVTVHFNRVHDIDVNDPPDEMNNPNYVFSFTTAAANTPPTVNAGGPYSGNEGSAIALDGASANDPDGDSLTYLWTVDNYNSNMDAGGSCLIADQTSLTAATITCNDDSNGGSFTVRLTATGDPAGPVSSTAQVSVANVAPTVSLSVGNTLSVTESNVTEHTYNYTRSDAGTNDVLTSTPSCGTAGTFVAGSLTSSSFKCKFVDGGPTPPGTNTSVSIYVTDDEGASSTTASQTVNISNANPVVAAPYFTATQVCQGSTATLTGISFSDAGVNDNPWAINIDWGDGSADYQNNSVASQGLQSDVSPTLNIPGTYTATITVTDKDGGSGSNTSSNTVTVVPHYSITFRQPVDGTTNGSVSNAVKLGRVVPVKILVWDNCANNFAGGYVTDPAAIVRIAAGLAPSAGGTLLDSVEAYADAGSANNNTLLFRWTADLTAPGGGFWIYNLDTRNSIQTKFLLGSTYRIDAYINGFLAAGSTSQYALLYMQK